jgi:signal transduction histidine kinase
MLAHSRDTSGERQGVDINALVEEALNLAYHGARALDQGFNITLERDLAPGIAPVELVPQDIRRVLLNLFSNGFYAANRKSRAASGRPVLNVATRDLGAAVEIRVRDNGVGTPPKHRDKLFQPFFTTKPTGEGTGLGLSISYEFITQQPVHRLVATEAAATADPARSCRSDLPNRRRVLQCSATPIRTPRADHRATNDRR